MRRAIEGKTPEEIRSMPKDRVSRAFCFVLFVFDICFQLEEPIALADFMSALGKTKPSVNPEDIKKFCDWSAAHGSV